MEEEVDRGGSEWMRYKRMEEAEDEVRWRMDEEEDGEGGKWLGRQRMEEDKDGEGRECWKRKRMEAKR
jgi:hypothetical protein